MKLLRKVRGWLAAEVRNLRRLKPLWVEIAATEDHA